MDANEQKLRDALEEAMREILKKGLAIADKQSSGTVSLKEMRRKPLDHPFAKRHPSPGLPPELINQQSGNFRRAWKSTPAQWSGGTLSASIENNSPEAKFLLPNEGDQSDGTRYMVARPIEAEVKKQLEPVIEEEVKRAITKAFGG